jgi:hypothetical protein
MPMMVSKETSKLCRGVTGVNHMGDDNNTFEKSRKIVPSKKEETENT